jgi:hypothetical protein
MENVASTSFIAGYKQALIDLIDVAHAEKELRASIERDFPPELRQKYLDILDGKDQNED